MYPPMQEWDESAFAAYVAGFTDGEGFMAAPPEGGLRIAISNTDLGVLNQIQERLGFGTIRSQRAATPRGREIFAYRVHNILDCERFLRIVRPYLVIKAAVADAMLERCEVVRRAIEERRDLGLQIREALATEKNMSEIARRFSVSPTTVGRIKSGEWSFDKTDARGLQVDVGQHRFWSSNPAKAPARRESVEQAS